MAIGHTSKPRVVVPDLKTLGSRLKKVDQHLVALLAKRMKLAQQVQERKHVDGDQPIIRPSIEDQRLADVASWAEQYGINPNFARSMLYFIISESCRVQIGHLQTGNVDNIVRLRDAGPEEFDRLLKENLLALTAEIASHYDESYGSLAGFATALYTERENEILVREVGTLRSLGDMGLALDLGCATGRVALKLASDFGHTIGYDISPHMIAVAREKKQHGLSADFEEVDLESGIPVESESASLVVMNLGTASDIHDLRRMLANIKRVLRRDGRFILSFYNANALLYNWPVPWLPSLAAEMNLDTHCLNVRCNGKLFTVYARPYSTREIKKAIVAAGLTMGSLVTCPTISSIFPSEFFDEQDARKREALASTARELEIKLSDWEKGAYVLVTGRKS